MPPEPVLCVGAALWDVIGRSGAPLAPGGDVPGRIERRPGGVALNVALALAALGREVALLTAVGRDSEGDELLAAAEAAGVDCCAVYRHGGATGCYVAIEGRDGALHAGVADCGGLERAGTAILAPLAGRPPTARVVADGNLPDAVLAALIGLATRRLAVVPASPAKAARLAPALAAGAAVYLNRREAEALCGRRFADSRSAARALAARGAAEAVVTDGAGAAAWAGVGADEAVSLVPPRVPARSLTGAGDALVAAHLVAREQGLAPEAALAVALAATARHLTRAAS